MLTHTSTASSIAQEAPRLVVICANQRSGTHALAQALESTGHLESAYEIFLQPGKYRAHYPGLDYGYFEWLDKQKQPLPFASTHAATAHLAEYMASVRQKCSKKYLVLDIKYDSWLNIHGPDQLLDEIPPLMNWLFSQQAIFIHIKRRNLFRQFFSSVVMNQLNKAHWREHDSLPQESFEVDPESCDYHMRRVLRQYQLFDRLLEPCHHVIDLTYEDLFTNSQLSVESRQVLQRWFPDVDLSLAQVTFQPSPITPETHLDNPEKLLAWFRGGKFESMVVEALRN